MPFGEYVPFRGLLEALGAPLDEVPNDAVAGQRPRGQRTARRHPPGRDDLVGGVLRRARAGGDHGDGTGDTSILLNPTNGASYTGTVLQTQQVASSKLRAIENGRWVVQVSPTGFSAFVDDDGNVYQRTDVSEQTGDHDGRAACAADARGTRGSATGRGSWLCVALLAVSIWFGDESVDSSADRVRPPASA